MIHQVIFLVALLILMSLTPEAMSFWTMSPVEAFALAMLFYAGLLGLVAVQSRRMKSAAAAWRCVNMEILLFLSGYYFLLGAHRLLLGSMTASAVFTLLLYFIAISIYYQCAGQRQKGERDVRLLVPMALPFVALTGLIELFQHIPESVSGYFEVEARGGLAQMLAWISLMGAFALFLLVVMPPAMVWIWRCERLADGPLRERLESLCNRASFRCTDLKVWTVLNHMLTAAILGVIPRFRYVLFTKRLLDELPPEHIEAILAHEIGHHYRRHLLLYPLILLGASLAIAALFSFWSAYVGPAVGDLSAAYPSALWEPTEYFALFVASALVFALYFRYVFGFFSRLCERQADLHVFHLSIDPGHLINALDEVAIRTGHSHEVPSWHHYSIKERMDFLTAAKQNDRLVAKHHRRVRLFASLFVCLLLIGFCLEVLWL